MFSAIFYHLHLIRYRLSRNQFAVVFGAGLAIVLTGTFVYSWLEDWSFLDSLYATVITVTTVGYGDLSPQTATGRLFAVVFTLISVGIAGYAISVLAAFVIERESTKVERILRKNNMKRIDQLNGHIIVCGANFVGSSIALEYRRTQTHFVLVEADEEILRQTLLLLIPEYYQTLLKSFGHARDVDLTKYESLALAEVAEAAGAAYLHDTPTDDNVLWRAGIARAAGLLATLPDDLDNLSIVIGARAIAKQVGNEKLRIISRVEDMRNIRKLYFSGADEVRTPASVGGAEMALHMTNPEIGKWWYARHREDPQKGHFAQVIVSKQQPDWIEKSVGDIHTAENVLIIALKRDGKYLSPPPQKTIVQREDIAITYH